MMMSSWSSPHWPWPLGASTPRMRKGMFFTRMIWPTGSSPGKTVLATVSPSRQTFSATVTSRGVKLAPLTMGQLRTVR